MSIARNCNFGCRGNNSLTPNCFSLVGVILESEDLHRVAYNAAFEHFDVRPKQGDVANWSVEFYDKLQNKIGGGKPKMRWYFGKSTHLHCGRLLLQVVQQMIYYFAVWHQASNSSFGTMWETLSQAVVLYGMPAPAVLPSADHSQTELGCDAVAIIKACITPDPSFLDYTAHQGQKCYL